MWDLLVFMGSTTILMVMIGYFVDPRQMFEDVKSLRGTDSRIDHLERRISELEAETGDEPQSRSPKGFR